METAEAVSSALIALDEKGKSAIRPQPFSPIARQKVGRGLVALHR